MKVMKYDGTADQCDRFRDMCDNEVQTLKRLCHPFIVNLVATSDRAVYNRKYGNGAYDVMYIVMELCGNGELIELLCQTGRFEEAIARVFFH
jgi:serine/threonine protein kinase